MFSILRAPQLKNTKTPGPVVEKGAVTYVPVCTGGARGRLRPRGGGDQLPLSSVDMSVPEGRRVVLLGLDEFRTLLEQNVLAPKQGKYNPLSAKQKRKVEERLAQACVVVMVSISLSMAG